MLKDLLEEKLRIGLFDYLFFLSAHATKPIAIKYRSPPIFGTNGARLNHPGYFLFSKILQVAIIDNMKSAIHPATGIKIKKTHAQWNFPSCKIREMLTIGIQASQGRLCFNFLAIVIHARAV